MNKRIHLIKKNLHDCACELSSVVRDIT